MYIRRVVIITLLVHIKTYFSLSFLNWTWLKIQGRWFKNPFLESQIFSLLIKEGIWLSALILHLAVCKFTIYLGSAVSVPRAVQPEGMIQKKREEVSTSKARKEKVAAVSNTITACTSIFYLMSNTLGLCRWVYTKGTSSLYRLSGRLSNCNVPKKIGCRGANIQYSTTDEILFRKTGLFHSYEHDSDKHSENMHSIVLAVCPHANSTITTELLQGVLYIFISFCLLNLSTVTRII